MPPTRLLRLPLPVHTPIRQPRRTFLSSFLPPAPPPQTLTASRRLPYNHAALYGLIADINSYSAFLPYCSLSRVTAWTAQPDAEFGRVWPTRADLTAGWGGLEQSYTSRVLCIPGSIVEALSGEGVRSGIAREVLLRHGLSDEPESAVAKRDQHVGEGVFKTLVTRWTVTPVSGGADRSPGGGKNLTEWSDVDLNIRFQFQNPLYGAVSSAVADKIAPIMIEAFVDRAKKILG